MAFSPGDEVIRDYLSRAPACAILPAMDKSWYILRVVSGTEVSVAQRLGLPAYVPFRLNRSFNRRHRRVVKRLLPALPGMVFVRTPDPRSPLIFLPGVLGWMRDGTRSFIALTEQDFRDMRHLEMTTWRSRVAPAERPVHKVGDRVQFPTDHVFGGKTAVIERLKGNRAFYRVLSSGLVIEADLLEKVA